MVCLHLAAQPVKRKIAAVRIDVPIKIDGVLDEAVWAKAPVATDFVEGRPVSGRKERPDLKTEVRVLYDDNAIYIGAVMHETSPDSIMREFAQRDSVGNADFLAVGIDTYNSGINGYLFLVTAAGSQYDALESNNNNSDDATWNSVWESAAKINAHDWTAEMRIPYSALRFSKKDVQTWGITFVRRRQISQQQLYWNPVDPLKIGFVNQWGELTGIEHIRPPLRLSLTPYISAYVDNYPYNTPGIKNTSTYLNGGMDLKYGINQSFTLDMTLVPDFGQVQSDNRILNLTPFEVRYNENRPFFMEGTELFGKDKELFFSKGSLFYSRRIGGQPVFYDSVTSRLLPGEKIVSNPLNSKLINATKVTGRTKDGLGIGVFNAVTERMTAVVEDDKGNKRAIETQPLTNYNVIVLDQSLKNNSSVSLINTSVLRNGGANDANVTSALFNLFTKNNKFDLNGQVARSELYGKQSPGVAGYSYQLAAGKSSGNFNLFLIHSFMDDKYDPNGLGILYNNNEIDEIINPSYSIVKPGKWYNRWQFFTNLQYSRLYKPGSYQNFEMLSGTGANLKNLWYVEADLDLIPFEGNDFYEPRVPGRVYKTPPTWGINIFVNTNQSKRYSVFGSAAFRKRAQFKGQGIDLSINQNYRVSNRFSLAHSISWQPRYNYSGFATYLQPSDSVIFGRRNVNTVENVLSGRFDFNSKMGVTLRVRHYVSIVDYRQYYLLDKEGRLGPVNYNGNQNIDFNLFNVDFLYSWWFAPGSQLTVGWKNSGQTSNIALARSYFTNLDNTLGAPQLNSFSVKVLYYLDYSMLRKRHRG